MLVERTNYSIENDLHDYGLLLPRTTSTALLAEELLCKQGLVLIKLTKNEIRSK